MQSRIAVLDGFRAVAILMVVGYHYFSRWTAPEFAGNLYPYGAMLRDELAQGRMGVYLFFIVSGFVISLTLDRCAGAGEFALRRFARLWPPMLLASALTYLGLVALPLRAFPVAPHDFLPSLTFTSPEILERLTGLRTGYLDGAYWSLAAEVAFYFWAALFYFTCRRRLLVPLLVFMNLSLVAQVLAHGHGGRLFDLVLITPYVPWFCAGVGFYALYKGDRPRMAALAIAECAAVALFEYARAHPEAAGLPATAMWALFFALFLAFLYRPRWVAFLGSAPLAGLGAASYSLYLLHQRLGVALIAHLAGGRSGPATALYAVGVAALMVVAALAIYRFWEVPAKRFLLKRVRLAAPEKAAVRL